VPIIISEHQDIMTDLALEWLSRYGCPTVRIQDTDFATLNLIIEECGNVRTASSETKQQYWVRRGREQLSPSRPSDKINNGIRRYLFQDSLTVSRALEHSRKTRMGNNHTGSFFAEKETNKLTNLTLAGTAGLKVPVTCVTNNKKTLRAFAETHETVITKDLRAPANISLKNGSLAATGVFTITTADVETMEDYFAPTLAQAYTPKQFEIRTFIFRESLFSMAIFSQNDEQTSVDFRNYNVKRPNRCVPFQLPKETERKLLLFMESANLDTGSVDLIYTPDGEYVFLEVNPMGQFHWLSENCNYYLEEFIANQLAQV
jgi:ATP-GRASP peptide maturase of grasp-with-spasm system